MRLTKAISPEMTRVLRMYVRIEMQTCTLLRLLLAGFGCIAVKDSASQISESSA